MLLTRFVSRTLAGLLFAASSLVASSTLAHAGVPITGTVTNKTNGKPAAGDQVTLIQLQQGMQESTHTTTDARGHFTLAVPDEGIHLIRVTHQKANYFQPVQPDEHQVAVAVYDAAASVDGVHTGVEELHVEASATELHVVEVLQVKNDSSPQRTQFGPKGFEFYLPKGALLGRTGAITQGGMPVQTPAVPLGDPGHFTFLFPIRPGETQFGLAYTLAYTGKYTFTPQIPNAIGTFAVLLPTSMTLTPGTGTQLSAQGTKPGTQTFLAQNLGAGQPAEFTVSGTGTLPEPAGNDSTGAGTGAGPNSNTANSGSNRDAAAPNVSNSDLAGGRGLNNPLDENGDRDPWAKYKWWILAGLAFLLAGAAGVLLRKPAGAAALPPLNPVPQTGGAGPAWPTIPGAPAALHPAASHFATMPSNDGLLGALRDELFTLETERLQRRITEADYREARAAVELILSRALDRAAGRQPYSPDRLAEQPASQGAPAPTAGHEQTDGNPERTLTGSPKA